MTDTTPGRKRVFFVHVMKTGGVTMFEQLRRNFERDELYPSGQIDIRYDGTRLDVRHHLAISYLLALPPDRRERIRAYTGHFPYVACELLGEDFTTITLLREPVARTISVLRQFTRNPPWVDPDEPSRMASRTLAEAYDHPQLYEPLIHDHQTKIFSMTVADRPESYMDVIDVDRSRLALAKEKLANVDVVGLTEAYDDFLDDLEERLGWRFARELRANVTPAAGALEPVTEELRERIIDDNAIDIEFYEYAKELVALRRPSRRPASGVAC